MFFMSCILPVIDFIPSMSGQRPGLFHNWQYFVMSLW